MRCLVAILMLLSQNAAIKANGVSTDPTLAVVVQTNSACAGLSTAELKKILVGDVRQWPDHLKVVVVERDADSSVYRQMLLLTLRMSAPDYKRLLLSLEFRGEERPLIKVLNSDEGAIDFVRNVPGAIAVVEAASAQQAVSRVRTLRVDGKLPGDAGYPLK